MGDNEFVLVSRLVFLPALFIVGGFVVVVATIIRGAKFAEHRHRERMAMIERGIVPAEPADAGESPRRSQGFKLTAGIMLCGFGLALAVLITFAAQEEDVALGVGGAIVMVGLAFIAAAFVPSPQSMPPAPPAE